MTMTLKRIPQPSSPVAMKAERERDKAQAMLDYQAEQFARQANMARLRDLRLAKERTDALAAAARRLVTKKAEIGVSTLAHARRRVRKTP
jgi:hypothetical protein